MQSGMLVVFHLLAANSLHPLLALGGLTTAYSTGTDMAVATGSETSWSSII